MDEPAKTDPTVQRAPAAAPVTPSRAAPAAGQSTGANATLSMLPLANAPRQDLLGDGLLATAPRVNYGGADVPALGGIPILAKLGQGGMGAVYFGVHPRLRMEVAVKVLPFQMASQQPALVQRFFREAQIAARVKSPHLVGVIDVNEEHGLFYLIMEYVDGITAGAYLRQYRIKQPTMPGLDEGAALDVCIAACEGLVCAHANSVIHRDIKPENILIPKNKTNDTPLLHLSKLADLGLARCDDGDPSLTGVQSTMGTPGFMAPEQANDAKTAGKPADVFSMGATLYALLSGQPPFQETTSLATILAAIQKPHAPLSNFRADISPATHELIDRCLAKDPFMRLGDAAELIDNLKQCRNFLSAATVTIAGAGAPAPSVPSARSAAPRSKPLQPAPPAPPPPSSSLIENSNVQATLRGAVPALAPTAARPAPPRLFRDNAPPNRRAGTWTLAAVLAAVPILIGAGWWGWQYFYYHRDDASGTRPADNSAQSVTGATATGTGMSIAGGGTAPPAVSTPETDKKEDPKPAVTAEEQARLLEQEKQREATANAMDKQAAVETAKHDNTRKMLRERADSDHLAAADAQTKADDADKKYKDLDAKYTAAQREDQALSDKLKTARDQMREAYNKANSDLKNAEQDLAAATRPVQRIKADAEVKTAKQEFAAAQQANKRREGELTDLAAQVRTSSQSLAALKESRDRAEGAAANAKGDANTALARADKSAAELRAFNSQRKGGAPSGGGGGANAATDSSASPKPPAPAPNSGSVQAPAGPYKLFDGPHNVSSTESNIHDQASNKELPLKLYFPEDQTEGPFPVVIFSHDWLASRENYELLGRYWASHGYVVIHPSHADSASSEAAAKELLEKHDPYADHAALAHRVSDIHSIIDKLDQLASKIPELKNKIDSKHVAVAGHSLGAYTAMLSAGAEANLTSIPGNRIAWTDVKTARIAALLLLSPQGRGEGGLDDNSWKDLRKPMLSIAGTADIGLKKQSAASRRDPFQLSAPGDKYELVIDGAHHGLGGITGNGGNASKLMEKILGPDVAEQRDWVKESSLAFFDCYLKADPQAKAWLNPDTLKNLGNGKLNFEKR